MAEVSSGFTHLPWDSEFFGLGVARVESRPDTEAELTRVVARAGASGVDCLYYLVDAVASDAEVAAQRVGFRLVDLRTTLYGPARLQSAAPLDVRLAQSRDETVLAEIARTGHRASRFYCDGRFPRVRCDELYVTWLARSMQGALADAVLTIEDGGVASGYVTCSNRTDGTGAIGLFAIAERARGRGLGQRLLAGALHWFAENGISRVSVVTQGRNAAAQRAYQRAGFVTHEVQLWYHFWFAGQTGVRDA